MLGLTTVTGAGNNELWNLVVAQNRGAAMVIRQPQDQDIHQVGQPMFAGQQLPTTVKANQPQAQSEDFSGIGAALKCKGHLNYKVAMVDSELSLQWDVQGNMMKQAASWDFATNFAQMRMYLAMVGEQKMVTMIHTIKEFYSIRTSTNAYQGKVLGFIGDRRATKEPIPVCLPQQNVWQWFSGQAHNNKEEFVEFYDKEEKKNKWLNPGTGSISKMKAPYLLAIPNMVVEIIWDVGGAINPADILGTIEATNQSTNGEVPEELWGTVNDWCLVMSHGTSQSNWMQEPPLHQAELGGDR